MATEEAIGAIARERERTARICSSTNPGWRIIGLSVCFVVLYLALDQLSFVGALHGVGITPWSPSAGLGMTLLVINGLRYAPLVFAAELLSGLTLPAATPSAVPVCITSLVVTVGYTGAAAVLRRENLQAGIRKTSYIIKLLIVTVISSGLVANGFVAVYAATEVVPWSGFGEAVLHFWVGDAIGIVVLFPPLLLRYERYQQQPLQGDASLLFAELAAQYASIVVALVAVCSGIGGDYPLGLFYLMFPPLIWIAMRHGLPAASWAVLVIQIGLIAGLELQGHSEATLRAFQLFMLALAATGLVLGAVVSERSHLALALVDSEGRRTAILNTARDGILLTDARGTILSINPAVERLFSLPDHRLIGHKVFELLEQVAEPLDRLQLAARSPISEAAFWELDARRSDGTIFPIEFTAGRFDVLGVEYYTIVIRDITARRKAETRYRRHQMELAHVSRVSLAGEMAAGLAHELSQPLTAIIAYARGCLRLMAASAPDTPLLREGVGEIVQQGERAADVLSRLREFVRGGEYSRTMTEVKPLINAAVSLTRIEAVQQEVEIEAMIDPELPAVFADSIQIEQVLLNLLRNAMEAMEAVKTRRRSIVVEARRGANHRVEISVTDSGPGIPCEMTDNIFQPFVTTKPMGMGMGLSISQTIIKANGGTLRLARGVQPGASFNFDLPTADAEASSDAR